jgi:hypothetical protein
MTALPLGTLSICLFIAPAVTLYNTNIKRIYRYLYDPHNFLYPTPRKCIRHVLPVPWCAPRKCSKPCTPSHPIRHASSTMPFMTVCITVCYTGFTNARQQVSVNSFTHSYSHHTGIRARLTSINLHNLRQGQPHFIPIKRRLLSLQRITLKVHRLQLFLIAQLLLNFLEA